MTNDLDAALDYLVNCELQDSLLPDFADISRASHAANVEGATHNLDFVSHFIDDKLQEPDVGLLSASDHCEKNSTRKVEFSLHQPRRTRKAVIEQLRRQVAELTKTLQELKKPSLNQTKASVEDLTTTVRNIDRGLWKGIADRQFRQRQEVEAKNKVLRRLLQEQRRERKNLKRLFRRRCDDAMLEQTPDHQRGSQYLQNSIRDVKFDFKNLLDETKALYANAGKLLVSNRTLCPGRKTTLYPQVVSGVFMEIQDKTRVPFDFLTTAKAVWIALKGPKGSDGEHMNVKLCSQDIEQNQSTTTKHVGYTCVTDAHSNIYIDEIGVVQKFVEKARVLFVCRGTAQPIFENGGLVGLTIDESMIIVVGKGNSIPSGQTTMIETYLNATRDDDGRESAIPYREKRFVDNARKGWESKLSLLTQRIENVLFDGIPDKEYL